MGNTASRDIFGNKTGPNTGTGLDTLAKNQGAMREGVGMLPPKEVTIIDGAISGFEEAALIVDTEGGGAADDLEIISPVISANENLHPGMIITLRAKDPARVVTVKNSVSPNGINTADGKDIVLSPDWELTLRLVAGRWYEIQTRGDVMASDALARTNPATTTSRGIGRVATAAEALPGSTITNGPAFLDAATVKIAPTPTANAVPQADESGKLLAGWVSPDSNKADKDLSNVQWRSSDKTQIVQWGIPDYTRVISTAFPTGSTKVFDTHMFCYVSLYRQGNIYVRLNNATGPEVLAVSSDADSAAQTYASFFLAKGDVIYRDGGSYTGSFYWVPLKGG